MNELSIEELLERNPEAKEVFEENAKKLGPRRGNVRRKAGYGLALPYGGSRLKQDDRTETTSPAAASYQKF